ncbi:hypothetical protein Ddye_008142 [Dipteronia dyeriana]|uniref:Uncharacterized protein n=1 Tax=Dipteronia dyeriana TaxID=168575 RepID=A0AAE0CL13_9ROSI|nr:hypothetical protein Ddye_008142 [Dipteronia dyeriana]
MAEHLASIFGTEKDRVNCPFYFKIGACRHGDRCSRLHTKPSISPTLLLSNMYQRPDMITPGVDPQGQALDPRKIQDHFEDFYEDLFEELSKYGEIESLNICDNLADHMVGNVYVQFREEEHAANALHNLNGRFYAGRPIIVDFSPVTDFREATCRQYEENVCNRGGYCNFMHLKKISRLVFMCVYCAHVRACLVSFHQHLLHVVLVVYAHFTSFFIQFRELRRRLFGRNRRRRSHSRSRSRSPQKHRGGYEERPHGNGGGGRGSGRRDDDRDLRYFERGRKPRSRSPGRKGGRSRSPPGRRNRSPVRENSVERRARIEQWNREKEQGESGSKTDNSNDDRNNNGYTENGDQYPDPHQE